MQRRKFFLMAISSAAALMTGALARPGDRDRDRDRDRGGPPGDRHDDRGGGRDDWSGRQHWNWRDDRGGWHNDRDRYWRKNYGNRRYIGRDRIFYNLRRRHYSRFVGDPYWFRGRYVVKTFDRRGNMIFVEVNPYTADFIGVIRF